MTDNEIIEALECCSKDDGRGCPEDCPCYERDCAKDLYFIEKQAIDLINRQKAEIDALINGQGSLQKHIAEQKSEIERLNKTVVDLNANLSEAINCFTRMESLYKIKCKELDVAKANAIKEFDKRFTKELYILQGFGDLVNAKKVRKLKDNLVKEMTE